MNQIKSIDLFAGIGGIRLGFEQAFGNGFETVFISEWDENAQKTYNANFKDPFEIADYSLKEAAPEKDWEEKALAKIKRSEIVVVIAGTETHSASGVKKEVKMANDNNIKVVQIKPNESTNKRVEYAGVLYNWTWENIKSILA